MRWTRRGIILLIELSVLMELQADCYAGVWAHSTARRQLLERGDPRSCDTFGSVR